MPQNSFLTISIHIFFQSHRHFPIFLVIELNVTRVELIKSTNKYVFAKYTREWLKSRILVPSSAKCIATKILVIATLNGGKDFILRVSVCDIIRPGKELPVQS